MSLSSSCYRVCPRRRPLAIAPALLAAALAVLSIGCQEVETRVEESHTISEKAQGSFLESRIENLEEKLEDYPKRHDLRYQIAGIYFSQEDYLNAADELRKAIELSPENARYHYHLGRCYLKQNEVELAEASFREASKLMPGGRYSGVHFALGLVKFRQKDPIGAAREFERAIEADVEGVEPYYFLACAHDAMGNRDEAIQHFREYIARGGRIFRSNAIFFLEKQGIRVDREAIENAKEKPQTRPGADPFERG